MTREPETLGEYLRRIRDGEMEDRPKSDGGYLVPEMIRVDSPGIVAATYRFLGRLFGKMLLYERGREDFNILQAVRDETERAMREIRK